jgi:hypothetical protein
MFGIVGSKCYKRKEESNDAALQCSSLQTDSAGTTTSGSLIGLHHRRIGSVKRKDIKHYLFCHFLFEAVLANRLQFYPSFCKRPCCLPRAFTDILECIIRTGLGAPSILAPVHLCRESEVNCLKR